jgi:hypothetical protein
VLLAFAGQGLQAGRFWTTFRLQRQVLETAVSTAKERVCSTKEHVRRYLCNDSCMPCCGSGPVNAPAASTDDAFTFST